MQVIGPSGCSAATLARDAARVATWAQQAPPGSVAVATSHDASLAALALGVLRSGRVLLPLDPLSPGPEVAPLLEGVGLLCTDEGVDWPAPPGARVVRVAPHERPSAWQRLLGRAPPATTLPALLQGLSEATLPAPATDQVALLLRTSGTTGTPRRVPWTHAALHSQLDILQDALEVRPGARLMNLLPMHHIDGLVMGLLLAERAGAALVRVGPRVVEELGEVLDTVWRERVSHLILTPTLLSLVLRVGEDLRELFGFPGFQALVSTAAPLPDALWRRAEAVTGRPVVNVYGLTETGNLLFAGPGDTTRRVGTVGWPRGCALRTVGPDGAEPAPGEPGELLLRGPTVMTTYADGTSPLREGWYPTGDLATVDPDGAVRIVGRLRAMISVGGLKVAPLEVEQALREHPQVRDARVWGEPDALWGERVVAEVVVEGLDEAAVLAHLRGRLAEARLPRELRLVGRVARGATGKPISAGGQSPAERVLGVAARVFRVDPERLGLSARPGDLRGWDSMGHLDLVQALEAEFGRTLDARDLLRMRCLADAVRLFGGEDAG